MSGTDDSQQGPFKACQGSSINPSAPPPLPPPDQPQPRRIECEWCRTTFLEKRNLTRHEITCLKGREGPVNMPFECDECKKRFVRSDELLTHLRRVARCGAGKNLPLQKPHACPCGKAFGRPKALAEHKKICARIVQPPAAVRASEQNEGAKEYILVPIYIIPSATQVIENDSDVNLNHLDIKGNN